MSWVTTFIFSQEFVAILQNKEKKKTFLFMIFFYVCVCESMNVYALLLGDQKGASDPLRQELEEVMTHRVDIGN